ncbi:DEKNAAC102873 [Brettanomyces naardenensis]|uniref:DEKNAAC102873 n=1 Tax=Brettanomyces naardenensis TaxID=13370 RepID=A0A448YM05_BRENA|nr:DEKNAAC102873 [Brettanomyces naardenensis]
MKAVERIRGSDGNIDLGLFQQQGSKGFVLDEQTGGEEPRNHVPSELSTNVKKPSILDVHYEFGDSGSNWRMMKLNKTFESSKDDKKSVEEVALDRYGDLALFYIALEEREELERRKRVQDRSKWVLKPTGCVAREHGMEIGREELEKKVETAKGIEAGDEVPILSSSYLAKLQLDMMKARIRKAPDYNDKEAKYLRLKEEYDRVHDVTTIPAVQPPESSLDEDNMTVESLARNEKTISAKSELEIAARQLASIKSFDDKDLDAQDEMASRLANLASKKGGSSARQLIDNPRLTKALQSCIYCCDNGTRDLPIVKSSESFYLTLLPRPEITGHGSMIVPHEHLRNSLYLEKEQRNELENIMTELSLFYFEKYHESVIFYENSVQETNHFTIRVLPLPISYKPDVLRTYFVNGIMEQYDENTSQHKPILETGKNGKRYDSLIAKEAPFYHVWLTLEGGIGHIIENEDWPRGDLFTREVIGGMLGVDEFIIQAKTRIVDDDGLVKALKEGVPSKFTGM